MGAETQSDAAELLRIVRNDVQDTINSSIENEIYDIGVDGWDCIVILMDDGDFGERVKFSKAKRDMDFRLRVSYRAFMEGDESARRALLLRMLFRSLELLEAKGGNSTNIDRLKARIQSVCMDKGWDCGS